MQVSQIERRGKGRVIVHFMGFGSEWLKRDKRGPWRMDSNSYGKWEGKRLPREGDEI